MDLKPQDLLVLLKVAAHPPQRWAYAALGEALAMSASEAHASHDIEDVLNIVDGREELAQEMAAAPADLRQAVAVAFHLLANPDFANALPGLIAEPERARLVMQRLKTMCP